MDESNELKRYQRAYKAACEYLGTKDDAPKGHTWQSWFLSMVDVLFVMEEEVDASFLD